MEKTFPTPFYIYDEAGIIKTAKYLIDCFSWADFKEYFAVKATPTPSILQILKETGCGADCSSLAELILSEKVGIKKENIMFTSNNTLAHEYRKALELDAIINIDDISHIDFLSQYAHIPETMSIRYNPGTSEGNDIIGAPIQSKFGATKEQIFEAYTILSQKGVKHFGLHTMIASNMLEPDYFKNVASTMLDFVVEIYQHSKIKIEFLNLGGGFGIPYTPEEKALDITNISKSLQSSYKEKIEGTKLHPLKIYMEHGRYITGPHGYLVTKAIHKKNTYKNYIGVDACMADLMRPGMYGAYHHISILGKEITGEKERYDVVGSLCENNDKFAIDRELPSIEQGDIIVIHDAGAHGHAMGFNYNGKLRPAEFLLTKSNEFTLIRRAETLDDYFATVIF